MYHCWGNGGQFVLISGGGCYELGSCYVSEVRLGTGLVVLRLVGQANNSAKGGGVYAPWRGGDL